MKTRPWSSTAALRLALPVVASLTACDTGGKPSSTCADGRTGLSGAATCSTTTPGNTTPDTQLGATTNNAALVGEWGITAADQKGQVWSFQADGSYSVISYQLAGASANVEVTLAGRFAAANGTINVTAEQSTCTGKAAQAALRYSLGGKSLTVDLGDGVVLTYTKGNAPNSQDFTLVRGCFDRTSGTFAQASLMPLEE